MKDLRVSRRRVLKAAAGTGAVAAVMGAGPRVVFAKNPRQLGPFSPWSEPVNLGPAVNSTSNDFHPGISKDELSLYFTSDRPGGVNGVNPIPVTELWVTSAKGWTRAGNNRSIWGARSTPSAIPLASPI
jgi:hypothetical protein